LIDVRPRNLSLSARLAVSTLSFISLCAPLAAQQLRGEVVLPDSSTRASGVIIVATDARGVVTRALSALNGGFLLKLPHPGQFGVQALRIGFRPTVFDPVSVAEGETKSLHITLTDTPVSLAAVTVRGENVCHIGQDSALLVAKIWQEARTAIAATQLTASDEPLVAKWMVYDSLGDRSTKAMQGGRIALYEGPTTSVFRSVSADSLERVGYVTSGRDSLRFEAPDANVLLSDSFAGTHCFYAQPPTGEHTDWIGVGFQPSTARAGLADILGTVWLDRQTAELRRLDFRYTRLPLGLSSVQPGGTVEFMRLSSGNWIINRWSIRIPRAEKIAVARGLAAVYAPVAIQLRGGAVTEVRHVGIVLFRAAPPVGRILGVFDDATGQPIVGAEVIDAEAERKALTSVTGTVSLASLGVDSTVVQVRKIGYQPQRFTVATGVADTVPVTVVLKPLGQRLPAVTTTTTAGRLAAEFEQRRRIGIGHFITEDEIAQRPAHDLYSLLGRMPGLISNVTEVATGHGEMIVRRMLMHGGAGLDNHFCTPNFFLDGMYYPLDDGPEPLLTLGMFAEPASVKGVEVYENAAGIPAQFDRSASTGCGSVVIWTK
jgi:hypothetical protein